MQAKSFLPILGLIAGFNLAGCDLASITKAESKSNQPATEATVVGIWRTDVPAPGAPNVIVKVTMQIDSTPEHSMLISQRIPGADPNSMVEISHEYWSWKLVDGVMQSTKTQCEYRDPPSYELDQTSGCRAPLDRSASVDVKGNAWTIFDAASNQAVIFKKD